MKSLASPDVRISVIERVKTIGPDAQAQWGRMTAHQMFCHCADAFRVAFGEKAVSRTGTWLGRIFVKPLALYAPMEWPKGLEAPPEVVQGEGGTCPVDFASDRRDLILDIERFSRPGNMLDRKVHPIFGAMSEAEWKRWGYLHMDHHLRQFGA